MSRPQRVVLLVAAIAILAVAAARSTFTVDETQMAAVLTFGRPGGRVITAAGLHAKWPWQTVARADRRLHVLDLTPRERVLQHGDTVIASPFVCWRITPDVFTLHLRAGASQDVAARLDEIIWAELDAELLSRSLNELTTPTTDPAAPLSTLMAAVTRCAAARARQPLGVDVVQVRMRCLTRPRRDREPIYRDVATAYLEQANQQRADAHARAAEVVSHTRARIQRRLAETDVQVRTIGTDVQARIDRLRQEVDLDPAFRDLLDTMEGWRRILKGQSTLVLSKDSALARWLTGEALLEEISGSPTPKPEPESAAESEPASQPALTPEETLELEPAATQPESRPAPSTRPATEPAPATSPAPTTQPAPPATEDTSTSPATAAP